MLKRFFKKLNNKAFTLVEILLAVGLLAIASISIGAIIVSTQNNTAKMLNENELQQQLVEAQETLHNEILSTSVGIKFWTRAAAADEWSLTLKDNGTEKEKVIAFYNLDQKDYTLTKTYYRYDAKDKTLKVGETTEALAKDRENSQKIKVDEDLEESLSKVISWSLVSSNVEEFSVDLSVYKKNRLISYDMLIVQEGSKYPADDTIYMRNEIGINEDLNIDKYHNVKIAIPYISEDTLSFVYDSREHSPTEVNYLQRFVTRTAESVTSATETGVYTITYVLKDKESTTWTDGTTRDITVNWAITKREVTITWGETSWVYDGQPHSTTVTLGNIKDGDVVNPVYHNNSVGPNVGEQVVTVTVDNKNYSPPAQNAATIKITKQPCSATLTIKEGLIYNGTAQQLVNISNVKGGEVKWYVSTVKSKPAKAIVNETTPKATNAGVYYIYYRIEATSTNYSSIDVTYLGQCFIDKRQLATYKTHNFTYNETEHIGVTGDYIIREGTWKETKAGEHEATVRPDDNHYWKDRKDSQPIKVSWIISKAAGAMSAPTAVTNLVYTGSPQTLAFAGSTDYGKMQYRLGTSGAWQDTVPQATNAGEYVVYFYSTGDDNHEATAVQSINCKIAKKPSAWVIAVDSSYTGSEQNGYSEMSNVTLTGDYKKTAAGTYTFKATPDANYCWKKSTKEEAETRTFTWTIAKVETQYTPPVALTLEYNGNSQNLVSPGSTSHGTMKYRLGTSGEWTTSVPTAINAGNYKVYYYVDADANHEDTAVQYIDVTITRKPSAKYSSENFTYNATERTGVTGSNVDFSGTRKATNAGTYECTVTPKSNYAWSDGTYGSVKVTWKINKAASSTSTAPSAKTLTYNGNAQNLINAGATSHGTLKYRLKDGSWSTSVPKGTNAGTYTVEWYIDGDDNHNDSAVGTISVTISKAKTATLTSSDKTYNGKEQTGASGTGITWTNTGYKGTNAGSYTAKAKPDSNHEWEGGGTGERETKWKIVAAAGTYTAPSAKTGLTYNGSNQDLINAGSCTYGTFKYKIGTSGTEQTDAGKIEGKDAGKYTVYWTLTSTNSNYQGASGSFDVTIARKKTASATGSALTYSGSEQTGVTGSGVTLTNHKATVVGSYTAKATPTSNYAWPDGKTDTRNVSWSIGLNKSCSVTKASDVAYDGNSHNGYTAYSSGNMDWSGTYTATNAGTYKFTCTPKTGYAWSDGSTGAKEFTWKITRAKSCYVTKSSDQTWTGSKLLGYTAYSKDILTWTGTYEATSAGTYKFYCEPKANYAWSDGSTDKKTFEWKILPKKDATASSNGNHEYNGSPYTGVTGSNVEWYDGHEISQTEPGTYTCWAKPLTNHAWSDGSTSGKSFSFTITGKNWKVNDPCRVKAGAKWTNGKNVADHVPSTQYYIQRDDGGGDFLIGLCPTTTSQWWNQATGTINKQWLY